MPGRPRKPTALKLLQGTFQPCRANPDEPQPELVKGTPDPPRRLKGEAKKEWLRTAPELARLGVLAVDELSVLATYCGLHAAIVAGERRGELIPAGYYAQYRGMVEFFGLSPSTRSKVRAARKAPPKNDWQDLANNG